MNDYKARNEEARNCKQNIIRKRKRDTEHTHNTGIIIEKITY